MLEVDVLGGKYSHEPYVAVRRFSPCGYLKRSSDELEPKLFERGSSALQRMEIALGSSSYLVGYQISLADIALVAYTRMAGEGGFDLSVYPAVRRWISRCEHDLNLAAFEDRGPGLMPGLMDEEELFIVVTDRDGATHRLPALEGWRVMEIVKDAGLPLKAECGGALACATCHVYVAPQWSSKLFPKSDEEDEMLDQAFMVKPVSRLSCQILMSPELNGLEITLAPEG